MKTKSLIIPLLFIILTGCSLMGTPLDENKKDFIGIWQTGPTRLVIYEKGRLDYKEPGYSMEAPIQEFTDEYIKTGIWFIDKTFTIDRAPYQENGEWKMQIDGKTFTRGLKIHWDEPVDENQEYLDDLYKKVPEINSLEQRIMTYAEAEVRLTMYVEAEPDATSKDVYARDYYRVYVGESHATHNVMIYRFLIHKDTKKISVIDPVTFEPMSLKDWREQK